MSKPIYGHWSGIATTWTVFIPLWTLLGALDVLLASSLWWLCFWMWGLAIFAGFMLRGELAQLKAGREREQHSIATHEAYMAEIAGRFRA